MDFTTDSWGRLLSFFMSRLRGRNSLRVDSLQKRGFQCKIKKNCLDNAGTEVKKVSFGLIFDYSTIHKGCEYILKLLGCGLHALVVVFLKDKRTNKIETVQYLKKTFL
jgi:hypothetical protein